MEDIITGFSVNEILHRSAKADDMFEKQEGQQFNEYMLATLKCFQLQENGTDSWNIFRFFFKSRISRSLLSVSIHGKHAYDRHPKRTFFLGGRNTLETVRFVGYITHRYLRYCRNYLEDETFRNRDDCMSKCFETKMAHLPYHYAFEASEKKYSLTSENTDQTFEICDKTCPRSCTDIKFLAKIVVTKRKNEISGIELKIVSVRSIFARLQLSFDLFVINSIGFLSASFGLCIISARFIATRIFSESIAKPVQKCAYVIAMLGFLWQFYDMTEMYLGYQIATERYIGPVMYETYPNLSICRPLENREFHISKPWQCGISNRTSHICLKGHFDDKPDYSAGVVKYDSTVSNITTETLFYVDDLRCINVAPIYPKIIHKQYVEDLYRYSMPNTSTNMIFSLTYDKMLPKRSDIITSQSSSVKFIFKIIRQHLLPAPFASKCINYKDKRFLSRLDCIQKCLIAEYKKQTREICIPPSVATTKQLKVCPMNETIEEQVCPRQCPAPDCYSVAINFDVNFRVKFVLSIANPSEEHFTKELPCLSILAYLIYVSDILSLWFGLNILATCRRITEFLANVRTNITQKSILRLVYAVIFLGTTVHSYQILMNHLKYSVITITSYERQALVEIPRLCLQSKGNGTRDVTDRSNWATVKIRDPRTLRLQYLEQYNHSVNFIRRTEGVNYFCLTLPHRYIYIYDQLQLQKSADLIAFKAKRGTFYYITSQGSSSGIHENPARRPTNNSFTYNYFLTSLLLLPSPYSSDCVIYYYDNADTCFHRCYGKNYRKKYDSQSEEDFVTLRNIMKSCTHICRRPSCKSDYYTYTHRTTNTVLGIALDDFVISAKYMPLYTIADLIVFAGGVLGFWLGVSLIDVKHILFIVAPYLENRPKPDVQSSRFQHHQARPRSHAWAHPSGYSFNSHISRRIWY
ncbi:hypothetical protein HDE_03609 [Halotydeus destructor]|nr:hypothetical protein HDE_03609 [Halotydeus destructor]